MVYTSLVFLSITSFITLFHLLKSIAFKKRRFMKSQMHHRRRSSRWKRLYRLIVEPKDLSYAAQYQQLLHGCGFTIQANNYVAIRRLCTFACITICLLVHFFLRQIQQFSIFGISIMIVAAIVILLTLFDKVWLGALKRRRSERITEEVYLLSNQLLYYSTSKMNLHSKLIQCIPYTKSIRNDLYVLVNEWYEDAELAIHQFKMRLGTDEGFSFAETLNSLRHYDSAQYYDLLRQRIQDYKEKLELHTEGKKELNSYVLFILAGLPILNTFRIFIHPWVQEGQKLFESLN